MEATKMLSTNQMVFLLYPDYTRLVIEIVHSTDVLTYFFQIRLFPNILVQSVVSAIRKTAHSPFVPAYTVSILGFILPSFDKSFFATKTQI